MFVEADPCLAYAISAPEVSRRSQHRARARVGEKTTATQGRLLSRLAEEHQSPHQKSLWAVIINPDSPVPIPDTLHAGAFSNFWLYGSGVWLIQR